MYAILSKMDAIEATKKQDFAQVEHFLNQFQDDLDLSRATCRLLCEETSPTVFSEILTAYKSTLRESRDRLKMADSLPYDELYKICHKLKGSSLLIGFHKIGGTCIDAMKLCDELRTQTSKDAQDKAQRLFFDISEAISDIIDKINFS